MPWTDVSLVTKYPMLLIFWDASSSLAASTESLTSVPVVSMASNLNVGITRSSHVGRVCPTSQIPLATALQTTRNTA